MSKNDRIHLNLGIYAPFSGTEYVSKTQLSKVRALSIIILFYIIWSCSSIFTCHTHTSEMGWKSQSWKTISELFLTLSDPNPAEPSFISKSRSNLSNSASLDLSTLQWSLVNEFGNITVPASIPSHVHLDLLKANIIPDPYNELNHFDLRWVALSNWTYSTIIPHIKSSDTSWLLFNGLDTFTDINLCNHHIASTNNQFRQYYFDVTNIIKICNSSLELIIDFGSAANIAKEIANQPNQETWPEGVENIYEFQHRQFVRKQQSDFGWDWGPAFVPSGIWQPAYFVQLDKFDVHVRNSMVDVYRQDQLPLLVPNQQNNWVLNTSIDVIGKLPTDSSLNFTLCESSGSSVVSGTLESINQTDNTITGSTIISNDKVQLWWPIGMGRQKLYDLKINIIDLDGLIVTSLEKKIGFRTIILNQEPVTSKQIDSGVAPGSNWHFEINGHEFYAKGSNMIPPDTFWTRVTENKIRKLFDAVVSGNQNMLRVWSSGAYLPDFIYDMADEMGILLWSEFEFGCAAYPANEEFLQNVKEEANYQVRRINHHPSLSLWAGGNEMENLVLPTAQRGSSPENFQQYIAEYESLFLDTLGAAVFENSKSISYTPSSTSNGWKTLDWSKSQPISQRYWNVTAGHVYGDTDYYNYDYEVAFNIDRYPVGRFANEFGFHSMPSLHSWKQVLKQKDLSLSSPIVRLRTHHYAPGGLATDNFEAADKGIAEMTGAATLYYATPNKSDPIGNFSSWCHLTQIFQADYYSSQIQFYRRGSGLPERQLGSLYWQLNDIWQAPTWSGIEYDGRWKILHYIVKDRYSNVIISPFYNFENDELEIWVTSDLWSEISGIAKFKWYNWNGDSLSSSTAESMSFFSTPEEISFSVGAINSTRILQLKNFKSSLGDSGPDATLHMEINVEGYLPNSDVIQKFHHSNWFHPMPLSRSNMKDPGLTINYLPDQKKFRIIATKAIASWVWLDYPSGALIYFDRNGFWLKKGEKIDVGFTEYPDVDITNGRWVDNVTIQSLWDIALVH